MKRSVILLFAIIAATISAFGQAASNETIKVAASPGKGFQHDYYLVIPGTARSSDTDEKPRTLLVSTNNTGTLDDDILVHEKNVKFRIAQMALAFGELKMPILMPVFPRPKGDWKIYTHAIDRDTFLTDKKEYRRLDLQLASMIADARKRLDAMGVKTDKRVAMWGFSAAGMFANRFALLHPELVKAAAIGSPGGWPMAPVEKVDGKTLRYPLGIADLKTVAGRAFNKKSARSVKLFFMLGDKDDNDSLLFSDGYEEQDKLLVFELFGEKPIDRWPRIESIYRNSGMSSEFKLYPGVEHKVTPEMVADTKKFFAAAL